MVDHRSERSRTPDSRETAPTHQSAHSFRDANLRSLGLSPSTWEQPRPTRKEELPRELADQKSDLMERMKHMSLEGKYETWQNWINGLPERYKNRLTYNMMHHLIHHERMRVKSEIAGKPLEEQQRIYQEFVDSLPAGDHRERESKFMNWHLDKKEQREEEHKNYEAWLDTALR